MAVVGILVVVGHVAYGGVALTNPVADQCQRSIAGDLAGCGFRVDQSKRTGGFVGGFARACMGGGHHFHEMPGSVPQNDAANERAAECFTPRERC